MILFFNCSVSLNGLHLSHFCSKRLLYWGSLIYVRVVYQRHMNCVLCLVAANPHTTWDSAEWDRHHSKGILSWCKYWKMHTGKTCGTSCIEMLHIANVYCQYIALYGYSQWLFESKRSFVWLLHSCTSYISGSHVKFLLTVFFCHHYILALTVINWQQLQYCNLLLNVCKEGVP
jgi:hypothetical protein